MVARVATFAMSESLLKASLAVQSRLADAQTQEASGIVSSDYAGLGSDASSMVDMEVTIQRATNYQTAAETADTRVTMMYSAVTSISDLLIDVRSDVNGATDEDSLEALEATASTMLDELTSLLNSEYNGSYLFGGTSTTDAPVDLGDTTVTSLSEDEDEDGTITYSYSVDDEDETSSDLDAYADSYYSGSETLQSVKVSDSRTVSYGTTADDDAFSSALIALSYIASGNMTTDDVTAVSDLLQDAIDGVADILSNLGTTADTLESAATSQEDYASTLSDMATDLGSVDIASIAVTVSNYESQLEASYAALASFTSMSLLDYMS